MASQRPSDDQPWQPWHLASPEDVRRAKILLEGLSEALEPLANGREPDVGQLLKCAHDLRDIGLRAVRHEAARMGDFAEALRSLAQFAEVTPEAITQPPAGKAGVLVEILRGPYAGCKGKICQGAQYEDDDRVLVAIVDEGVGEAFAASNVQMWISPEDYKILG